VTLRKPAAFDEGSKPLLVRKVPPQCPSKAAEQWFK
jgi:hypothetical protein